jgi:6-phosphogluconate dehydrogenase
MIHNGIEYGLMQAYAEGFEIMKAKTELGLDLHQIAEIWRHGQRGPLLVVRPDGQCAGR